MSEPGYAIAWTAPALWALSRLREKVATAVVEFLYGSLAASPHRVGMHRIGVVRQLAERRGIRLRHREPVRQRNLCSDIFLEVAEGETRLSAHDPSMPKNRAYPSARVRNFNRKRIQFLFFWCLPISCI